MASNGQRFEAVEAAIEQSELTDQEKAGLWLLAWSLREPASQRRDARRTLALLLADDKRP